MEERIVKVGLVIPVHNRRATTLQALGSLHKVDTRGIDLRIFVVDDGSTDGTSEAIELKFPDVVLIQGDGTLHYAAGTNRGIEAALKWDADFVVTMNDDSIFHRDFLTRLVTSARMNVRAIVGSLLLLWDRPHMTFQVDPEWRPASGGWVFPSALTAFEVGKEPFEVQCLVGNCVLIPAEAIRENGLMDERNFPCGWGDAQYMTRMRRAGWTLLVDPLSRVWCEPNTYPRPLHSVSLKDRFRTVFLDSRHPANLGRQFKALWFSAPSKPSALLAFTAYIGDLTLKAFRLRPFASKPR